MKKVWSIVGAGKGSSASNRTRQKTQPHMNFNLSKFQIIKKPADETREHTLLDLYPEGEREAIKEYGDTNLQEAQGVTKLYPERLRLEEAGMDALAVHIFREMQKERATGTKRVSENLQLQGEAAVDKLRIEQRDKPKFKRLLALTAFHPNPYVRFIGIRDFGKDISDLHVKYLVNDPNTEIQSQAQWESKRRDMGDHNS